MDAALTLACALEVERRAARRGGARAALVGIRAAGSLPDGRLVSFGLAGSLVPGLSPGALVTAARVVDESGRTLWEGEPIRVPCASAAVVCSAPEVVDDPAARRALADRSGAMAVDLESGPLAATGRLVGVIRAISDGAARPVGALARAARADGSTDWKVVARAFLNQPLTSVRAARGGRRGLASLERAATALAGSGR